MEEHAFIRQSIATMQLRFRLIEAPASSPVRVGTNLTLNEVAQLMEWSVAELYATCCRSVKAIFDEYTFRVSRDND